MFLGEGLAPDPSRGDGFQSANGAARSLCPGADATGAGASVPQCGPEDDGRPLGTQRQAHRREIRGVAILTAQLSPVFVDIHRSCQFS